GSCFEYTRPAFDAADYDETSAQMYHIRGCCKCRCVASSSPLPILITHRFRHCLSPVPSECELLQDRFGVYQACAFGFDRGPKRLDCVDAQGHLVSHARLNLKLTPLESEVERSESDALVVPTPRALCVAPPRCR